MGRASGVDSAGPVFLSYRQSDGIPAATRLAWLLRAAGVPVWHDRTDLPPGDTNERLDEALGFGLSGAILVVSPDIEHSVVVRNVELPRLLALEKDRDFVLAVASIVRDAMGKMDYGAPDRLLAQPAGSLARLKQHPADSREGLAAVAREILVHRLTRSVQITGPREVLHIDIHSRSVPHASDQTTADLSIRLRPAAAGRLPSRQGCKDLKVTLAMLPEALSLTGARRVYITGRAHPTIAFALGCALPSTLIGHMTVESTDGQIWQAGTAIGQPTTEQFTRLNGSGAQTSRGNPSDRSVLAYVDLLTDLSNGAYTRFLVDNPDRFKAWIHIRPTTNGLLPPEHADRVVAEVAERLRKVSQDNDNAEVHLLLRVPFPVAVLLGRLMNTLQLTVYEWDGPSSTAADRRPRFVPALTLTPTDSAGPITTVLIPKS